MNMTHDAMLAVISAARDGKEIECRHLGAPQIGWVRYGNGERFAFDIYEYRIKLEPPKPREWWLVMIEDKAVQVCDSQLPPDSGFQRRVHVREVL